MLKKLSRFYLSKKTFIIAIIATMILAPIGMIMEITLDDLIPFEIISYGVLYLLLIGLCITYHKKDYILMNGIVSGILIYLFVRYAYLFSFFANKEALLYYGVAGFFGYFCIAVLFMSIALVCLISYNHFTLNRRRAVNQTKIVLNQFLLFISFFIPIVYIITCFMLRLTVYETVAYAIVYFADALLLLVVACCELKLSMNINDDASFGELASSDVKATIWYAFSLLFSILCLSMAIILSNTKIIAYVFIILNLLFSSSLLIYYLNKKKKPSKKLKIYLYVGFISTIVIMAFFIGYFIITVLS